MIPFLVFCTLLIPVNLWAAITPHMHSDVSMRILHGVCTMVLLPLLWALWDQRRLLMAVPALVLAIFATVMVVVNTGTRADASTIPNAATSVRPEFAASPAWKHSNMK